MEGNSARADALAAVVMLLVIIPFALNVEGIYIDPFDPGFSAADFPKAVIGSIVVLSLFLLISSVRKLRAEKTQTFENSGLGDILRYILPMALIGVAYVRGFQLFQYLIPTMMVFSVILAMFGNRGAKRLVVIPVIAATAFYVVFFGVLNLYEFPGAILRYDGKGVMSSIIGLFGGS